MNRLDLRRRRALRAAAPLAGLLAAGLLVWQGSYAAFTATTTNTGDAWNTGSLVLANNGGVGTVYSGNTAALFGETGIKPGSTGAKCITVESTGSLAGSLRLWHGPFTGTNAANLSAALNVTVDAIAVGATTSITSACASYTGGTAGALYAGALSAMPASFAAATGTALAGGTERVAYRIGWTLPSAVTDNTLQSSNVTTTLTWEVQ
jgi:hypothetical protein